jgi:hypothetical protein
MGHPEWIVFQPLGISQNVIREIGTAVDNWVGTQFGLNSVYPDLDHAIAFTDGELTPLVRHLQIQYGWQISRVDGPR